MYHLLKHKHMKISFAITILILLSISAFGSDEAYNCSGSESTKQLYKDDAYQLAVERIEETNSNYIDSALIPKQVSDTLLNALIAVYNSTFPQRDTIIDVYNIHAFQEVDLKSIRLVADSTLPWVAELSNYKLNTGNRTIDSIITTFNLKVTNAWPYYGSNYSITLTSEKNINTKALTKNLDTIQGIASIRTDGHAGDGGRIDYLIYPDSINLIYSYGWGDCPSGCMSRHYWKFKVLPNCEVEFISSHGDIIPATSIYNVMISTKTLYPNPCRDFITLPLNIDIATFKIYNSLGVEVHSESITNKTSIDISNLKSGLYYISIIDNDKTISQYQFIKE